MNLLQKMGVVKGTDISLSCLREIITLSQIQNALSPALWFSGKRTIEITTLHCFFAHMLLWLCWSLVTKSCVILLQPPWSVACQAPLSTEFSRHKNWSELPFLSPGNLPHPGIRPCLMDWQVFFTTWWQAPSWKPVSYYESKESALWGMVSLQRSLE